MPGSFFEASADFGSDAKSMIVDDAVEAKNLPRIHGVPFDGIQAIQARRHSQVISRDPVFAEYRLKSVC